MSRAALVLVPFLLAACGGTASPSPVPGSPDPGSPEPQPIAVAHHDGVRVTLSLDGAPLLSGQRSWATVTVENLLPVAILWQGGGCDFVATITASLDPPVRPDPGRAWDGLAARFKELAGGGVDPLAVTAFMDERFVDKGQVACTADLRINELEPGGRLVMRAAWDGEAGGVPVGARRTTITASFPYMGPKAGGDPFAAELRPIESKLQVAVVDGGVHRVSPAQAIDAALGDARFAQWLASSDFATWQGVGIEVDGGSYGVGLTVLVNGAPVTGKAIVDRGSGLVTDFVTEPIAP